jgi:hypothetical protein
VQRGILVTIQLALRCKPRIVHIDKLAPVRQPFDGSWIKNLETPGRQAADEDLPLVAELFEQAEEEARLPPIEVQSHKRQSKQPPLPRRGRFLRPMPEGRITRSQSKLKDPG